MVIEKILRIPKIIERILEMENLNDLITISINENYIDIFLLLLQRKTEEDLKEHVINYIKSILDIIVVVNGVNKKLTEFIMKNNFMDLLEIIQEKEVTTTIDLFIKEGKLSELIKYLEQQKNYVS